jgi:hypothetical protein
VRWDAGSTPGLFGITDPGNYDDPTWDLPTTYISNTQLQVTIPAADLAQGGTHQISVRTRSDGGGVTASLPFTVETPTPEIDSLSVYYAHQNDVSGIAGQSNTISVTITGAGFLPDPSDQSHTLALTTVNFNGVSRRAEYVSSTQISVALGYFAGTGNGAPNDFATPGDFQITATNPGPGGGTSPGMTFVVLSPPPTITSLNPYIAAVGDGGGDYTVHGTGFLQGAVVQVAGASVPTTFDSSTQLVAHLPPSATAAIGSVEFSIINGDGQPSPSTSGQTPDPANLPIASYSPFVAGFTPPKMVAGSGAFTLTIHGLYFQQGDQVVWNSQKLVTAYVAYNELTAQMPAAFVASAGFQPLSVLQPNGISTTTSY